jgi:hypothetical protein
MNEILAPLYYVLVKNNENELFNAECDSFYTFVHLMSFIKDGFIRECDDY